MTTIDQAKVQAAHDTASRRYAETRNDPDISDEKRQRRLARVWVEHRDALATLSGDNQRTGDNRKDSLARRLYGLPANGDSLSYRDALDRAHQIDAGDTRAALRLLEQARVTGDDLLSRAILAVAYTNRWNDVVNAYTDANPTAYKDAEELWDLHHNNARTLLTTFALIAPKPRELNQYGDQHIENLAANEPA